MKIVNTCNFGGDYPDEKFIDIQYYLNKDKANIVCKFLNDVISGYNRPRIYKVVDDNYILKPGFEP